MAIYPWKQIKSSLLNPNQWLRKKPEQVLDEAYREAVAIAALEKDYFNGQKISAESGDYGDIAQSYFNSELEKSLKNIQIRLAEFNESRPLLDVINKPQNYGVKPVNKKSKKSKIEPEEASIILNKLEFIDEVIGKYRTPKYPVNSSASSPVIVDIPTTSKPVSLQEKNQISKQALSAAPLDSQEKKPFEKIKEDKPETSFLPRSLLGTLKRIKKELDPAAEEEVIKKFRKSKVKTIVSIRFILLLILVPLLVHQISKITVIGPLVDNFIRPQADMEEIFINEDLEEEALDQLHRYEEKIDFEILIGKIPEIETKEREELLHHKAEEIAEEYKHKSSNAIKNVFCDIISIVTFFFIITNNKKEVEIFKSFMDDLIYGLSDSAKAFIIILLTDMFVGFHSPHGWEVILTTTSRHFGLPENEEFNFLFIATFPVILDAVFKYWIFRYLNRSSPSAVATYKNMNE
jgi:hypothetical protein